MKKPKGKYAWTVAVGEKGLAIPPKSMFAQFAAAVFETTSDSKGEE